MNYKSLSLKPIVLTLSLWVIVALFTPKQASAAILSLDPISGTYTAGDTIDVEVVLDTENEDVIGAEVIIQFDSAKLEVETAELGDLFASKIVDGSISYGKIIFEAKAIGSNTFNGIDTFATITFNAVADGEANVDIKFVAQGETTDSAVEANDITGTDLLTQVDNAVFTIKPSVVSTTNTTSSSSATTKGGVTTTKTTVPVAGHIENTIAMLVGGILMLTVGIYLKRKPNQ